jgi:hypothetical protein
MGTFVGTKIADEALGASGPGRFFQLSGFRIVEVSVPTTGAVSARGDK